MSWVAVGAIGASLIGGAIGSDQANKKRADANAAREQALAEYANISIPDLEKQQLDLAQYTNAGTMTPEQEQLVNLGDTSMGAIALDPAARAAQMQALDRMSGYANGELTAGDLAGFELVKHNAASQDQAKQNQIMQEMQQRGQAGSGAELLARLKSSQSSADRLNQAGMEQAQQIQAARMAALQNQSNMGSQLRSQDYSEQSNLAKARDAISAFNAQNAQGLNSRNTQAKNQAQQNNLQNAQNLRNMNTENMNKQQIANKGLLQQQFNNQTSLAAAKAGQYGNQAQANDTQAAQTAGMWAGIGQGVGSGIAAYNKKD